MQKRGRGRRKECTSGARELSKRKERGKGSKFKVKSEN
jgi:hypothetical protein